MTDKGFILLHRKIQDCIIWTDTEPFDRRSAWLDLIMLCNHRETEILFDGKPTKIKRGQYLTSVRKLSERWHWGKDKTLRYLRLLESLSMVQRECDSKRTLLTVVNYGIYQDLENEECDSNKDTDKDTNKPQTINVNNENNINNIYINNIKDIVEFLNEVCGTKFKPSTDATKKHIRARLSEGYSVDDFKLVIQDRYNLWHNDKRMCEYLRPQTLFGTKFESYLNQANKKGVKTVDKGTGECESGYDELPTEEELARYYATE